MRNGSSLPVSDKLFPPLNVACLIAEFHLRRVGLSVASVSYHPPEGPLSSLQGHVNLNNNPRIPNPTALFNPNLCRDAFLHAFNVTDHADHLAAGVERVEGIQGDVQGIGVEGAEAFVEEERVD